MKDETELNDDSLQESVNNATLQQILDLKYFHTRFMEFHTHCIVKYSKLRSWENIEHNFGWVLKNPDELADTYQLVNGLLNEIKRLEKENETLKGAMKLIKTDDSGDDVQKVKIL